MSESSAHPLGIEPPLPHLIDGANEEELTINLGLGLVARKAAEAEYILHSIYVHLVEAEKAYSELAVATGGKLVQQCRKKLGEATLAASCKTSLTKDLDATEEGFRLRNRYLHGYWIYDDESYQWLTLKGAHHSQRPEITFTDSSEVWELAERFQKLCSSLLHWDTAHFGELADDEDGHQGLVSRKRV
ncbi:hypothetical protein ACGFWE_42700 [Streptomyces sp. NPDC048523]|uniref:hypothetical protein n=1 Tax=Streptomyces sp. NPDC048523 TaxID=3365567 RepID=UPI0037187BEF